MKTNLKELAKKFENALGKNEVENTVYHIVNGNYMEEDYMVIMEYLDISKMNFGKRNFNLVAYVGNRVIEQFLVDEYEIHLDRNQTISIYKYLSNTAKEEFNKLVKTNLIKFYEDF